MPFSCCQGQFPAPSQLVLEGGRSFLSHASYFGHSNICLHPGSPSELWPFHPSPPGLLSTWLSLVCLCVWNYHPSWYPSLNPCLDATCVLVFYSISRRFYLLNISGMCPLGVSCLCCASPGTDLAPLRPVPCRQVVVLLEYECDCHSIGPSASLWQLGFFGTRPGFLPLPPSYPKALFDSAILNALRSPQRLRCFSPLHRLLPVSFCLASPYL